MPDSFIQTWNKTILRCPSLSPKLAQDFVVNAFRRLAEVRRWSWLVKYGQFIAPDVYNTGTVTVVQGSATVTGSGTTFTSAMVGRQFRIGLGAPIYTVATFVSATVITLDSVYGDVSAAVAAYSIFQCFFTVPNDFHSFITMWDASYNWQLILDVPQSDLNQRDAQRSNTGNSYAVSFRDYTSTAAGAVGLVVQAVGSGNDPVSGGTYTGPTDATFVVEITTTGTPGTAVYKWNKNGGTYTTGVTTSGAGTAQSLQDGVTIQFPLAVSYTSGDVFVFSVQQGSAPGLPRYELWPYQMGNHVYPFLYEARPTDIDQTGSVIPNFIRGDVLVEMALADIAMWPGASVEAKNVYFNPQTAAYHQNRADVMIGVLERQDEEVWMQQISTQYPQLGWGIASPLGDASWIQSHSI